jgi:hypothetical protein
VKYQARYTIKQEDFNATLYALIPK